MDTVPTSSVKQLHALIEEAVADDKELKLGLKNLHQGYPNETLERFLKARDGNISKAFKMLIDCLHWRANNDIDNILSKLIEPKESYDAIRDSQLIGLTGYCKQGRPVFAIGVGLSGYDKAPLDKYVQSHIQINEYRDRIILPQATKRVGHYVGTCLKILDMSNLKLSALNRLKILTVISTVDDLNYPEKTDIYYIVNPPYIFSACWQVVRPLLQERTKRKIRVLQGCGKDELLKVMDSHVLPFFCQSDSKRGGSSKGSKNEATDDCYSSSHAFHVELWNHIKQQSYASSKCVGPAPQKSFHVEVPEPDAELQTIECALETALVKLADGSTANGKGNGDALNGMSSLSVSDE
ncbi:hypothetical protein GOP47_0020734 [Adiantum capillus-veneris]|uniref:CRAL-TRIO domain-containing protein n=1 Tax=Adiantum capillus-veneris TaxID=13818 RepID=A0A9D4UBB4_ADICA|nr:hypothetical protein GOP47_0020734 [Adiantum capillus-veneris]